MEDAINSVPPEAWPLIDLLFRITIVVTLLWLVWTLFIVLRRRASNLTAIRSAAVNRRASPDFLEIDTKARKAALARGEAYDKVLDKREEVEAAAARRDLRRKETFVAKLGRLVSFGMAVFSLATMISGTVFQVSIMGSYWEKYSAGERLMNVFQEYPIGVTVTVAVILFNIVTFITNRRWES